jgi:hypothetical protein
MKIQYALLLQEFIGRRIAADQNKPSSLHLCLIVKIVIMMAKKACTDKQDCLVFRFLGEQATLSG